MRGVDDRFTAVACRGLPNTWPVIIGAMGLLMTAPVPAAAQEGAAQSALNMPVAQAGGGESGETGGGSGDLRLAQAQDGSSQDKGNKQERDNNGAKKPTKNPDILSEIIVTAQRRAETLLTVPMAITALTSEDLDQLNAQNFDDYFRSVPGLALIDTGNGGRDFTLRGMNSNGIPTNGNTIPIATVSAYVDEIPITAAGFQLDPHLTDIDHIEVLRGPQGTYYGEGALAGTIRIITKQPVLDSFSASVESRVSDTAHGGSNNSEDAMFNLPIVEGKAALRLNAFYAYDSGYIDALNVNFNQQITGVHAYKQNTDSASGYRAVLLVDPIDQLSISVQAAHSSSMMILGSYTPTLGDLSYAVTQCPPSPPPGSGGGGGPGGPSMNQGCQSNGQYFWAKPSGDLYNITLNGDFGWANLVSSSSYAKTSMAVGQTQEQYNPPPTPGEYVAADGPSYLFNTQDQQTFAQEVRLVSSKSWSERWDYILGTYYQDKHTTYGFPAVPVQYGGVTNSSTQELKVSEKALFGDAGYMLTEHLQARLGVRESDVNNEGIITITPPVFKAAPTVLSHFTPFTGRAVLDDFISRDMTAYLSVARGFRNGNINDTTNNSAFASQPGYTPIPATSKPDTDTTYEFGWKQVFPAYRASLNAAVYYTQWQNMQVLSLVTDSNGSIPPGIENAYVNAPRAAIKGLELEGRLELLKGLQLGATWSFIDPRLTANFPLNLQDEGGLLRAKTGDYLPWIARRSGSLSLNYNHHAIGSFNGFVALNGAYVGPRTTDFDRTLDSAPPIGTSPIQLTTYTVLHSYWTSSMQLGVQNERWRIALYGDNLANARADLFHLAQGAYTDRPRTVGLWVRYATQ